MAKLGTTVTMGEIRDRVNSIDTNVNPTTTIGGNGAAYELWINASTGPDGSSVTASDSVSSDRSLTRLAPDYHAWYGSHAPFYVMVPQTPWVTVLSALRWAEKHCQGSRISFVLYDDANWHDVSSEVTGPMVTTSFREVSFCGAFNGGRNLGDRNDSDMVFAYHGMAASSVNTSNDYLTVTTELDGSGGHSYQNGDQVAGYSSTSLPGGLSDYTKYYIIDVGTYGANTFRLSTSEGGSAINLTSQGTGTHYLWKIRDPSASCPRNTRPLSLRPTLTVTADGNSGVYNALIWQRSGDMTVNSIEIKIKPGASDIQMNSVMKCEQGMLIYGQYPVKITLDRTSNGSGGYWNVTYMGHGAVYIGSNGGAYVYQCDFDMGMADGSTGYLFCCMIDSWMITDPNAANAKIVVGASATLDSSTSNDIDLRTAFLAMGSQFYLYAGNATYGPIYRESTDYGRNNSFINPQAAAFDLRSGQCSVVLATAGTALTCFGSTASPVSIADENWDEIYGGQDVNAYRQNSATSRSMGSNSSYITSSSYSLG